MTNTHATRFESLAAWNEGWAHAHLDSDAPFWTMDHMDLRTKPRQSLNEAMMVEKLWLSMGPLEHAWLARFIPDAREKYPLETDSVNPWNAAMAVEHYGMVPRFDNTAIDNTDRHRHPVPVEAVAGPWRDLRAAHGLETNCWQLTQELIASYHRREDLPTVHHIPYKANTEDDVLYRLQTLCPSPDWTLALACAGIASEETNRAFKAGSLTEAQHQEVGWLKWWLEKSPNCLDDLAWTWVLQTKEFEPVLQPSTELLLDLCQGAKDPRETFSLARQLYGDTKPRVEASIDSAALQDVLGPNT